MGMTAEDVLKLCWSYFAGFYDTGYETKMELDGKIYTESDMLDLIESVLTPPTPKEEDILEWNRIAK